MTQSPPTVQIFGRRDSRDTQKALRFFKERRVATSFVDISVRAPAPAELRRFSRAFGPKALLDPQSRVYLDTGLAYLSLDEDQILSRVTADPRLLRLPLVRHGDAVTIGPAKESWRDWMQGGSDAQ